MQLQQNLEAGAVVWARSGLIRRRGGSCAWDAAVAVVPAFADLNSDIKRRIAASPELPFAACARFELYSKFGARRNQVPIV